MSWGMEKKDLRIVFMGTPEFAEFCLRRLVGEGFDIVGVVTMPDKPIGRHGSVLQASPVKKCALEYGIPVLQPERLKDEAFLSELRALDAQLQIVVAFRMLPESVWNMPPMGTFNLHASLLPQYRGAAPINWAIINGDRETGVTTFFLKHDIDTGDIIHQERTPILDSDNAGTLHDRLMEIGASLVCRTAYDIIDGNVSPISQQSANDGGLRPAPKIFKETCELHFDRPVIDIHNLVRGLSPYPAAHATICSESNDSIDLKIYASEIESCEPSESIGTVVTDNKKYLKIALKDGYLHLTMVQQAGKKAMPIADFLRGQHLDGIWKIVPYPVLN